MRRSSIWVPSTRDVIRYNKNVLKLHRATKGDQHRILNRRMLISALDETRKAPGDFYDKTAVLLKQLSTKHSFASGNRRTAYFAANKMLWKNKGYAILKKQKNRADMMNKIRRGELSHNEIKRILK